MTYSVWRPSRREYDYYEDTKGIPGGQPVPHHLSARELGVSSARAGWPLPSGVKRIGSGGTARGMIALDGADGETSWWVPVGLAIAGWGLWKMLRKR